jgi:hypothetical protein
MNLGLDVPTPGNENDSTLQPTSQEGNPQTTGIPVVKYVAVMATRPKSIPPPPRDPVHDTMQFELRKHPWCIREVCLRRLSPLANRHTRLAASKIFLFRRAF